jgi:multidrug efflux pump subunit AcrA (membrane-fusion protein)
MSAEKLIVAGLCAGFLSWGCWDKKEKEPSPQPTVEQHSILVFPKASPMLDQIVAVPIEPRREVTLRFNGRLVWNEDRTARVFAPFAGRVQSIAVQPGEHVARGQALAVLAAPDFGVAQAEARKAENDYSLAQKNVERIRELAQAGVAAAKDLQAAEADVVRTASERARANARLKLYGKTDTVDQSSRCAAGRRRGRRAQPEPRPGAAPGFAGRQAALRGLGPGAPVVHARCIGAGRRPGEAGHRGQALDRFARR